MDPKVDQIGFNSSICRHIDGPMDRCAEIPIYRYIDGPTYRGADVFNICLGGTVWYHKSDSRRLRWTPTLPPKCPKIVPGSRKSIQKRPKWALKWAKLGLNHRYVDTSMDRWTDVPKYRYIDPSMCRHTEGPMYLISAQPKSDPRATQMDPKVDQIRSKSSICRHIDGPMDRCAEIPIYRPIDVSTRRGTDMSNICLAGRAYNV